MRDRGHGHERQRSGEYRSRYINCARESACLYKLCARKRWSVTTLKRIGFFCFPIKHSTHTLYQCTEHKFNAQGRQHGAPSLDVVYDTLACGARCSEPGFCVCARSLPFIYGLTNGEILEPFDDLFHGLGHGLRHLCMCVLMCVCVCVCVCVVCVCVLFYLGLFGHVPVVRQAEHLACREPVVDKLFKGGLVV